MGAVGSGPQFSPHAFANLAVAEAFAAVTFETAGEIRRLESECREVVAYLDGIYVTTSTMLDDGATPAELRTALRLGHEQVVSYHRAHYARNIASARQIGERLLGLCRQINERFTAMGKASEAAIH